MGVLASVVVTIRAVGALIGSILLWTGLWQALDEHTFAKTTVRDLAITAIGVFLTLLTGTFFSGAGVGVRGDVSKMLQHRDHEAWTGWAPEWARRPLTFVRSCLSMLGVVMVWFGLFNMIQSISLPMSKLAVAFVWLVVGVLIIVITSSPVGSLNVDDDDEDSSEPKSEDGTGSEQSNLLPDQQRSSDAAAKLAASRLGRMARQMEEKLIDWPNLSVLDKTLLYVRTMLIYVGPVAAWVGLWELLEEHAGPPRLYREIVYMIVGLVTMMFTRTLVSQAMLRISAIGGVEHDWLPSTPLDHHPMARAVISFCAYLLFWTGLETILDDYTYPDTIARDGVYLLLGALLLVVTDSFMSQAGVLTPMSVATNLNINSVRREISHEAATVEDRRASNARESVKAH